MGATAAMREPARLADRRGRTSDGNPGPGVHRGARRPDGHHALHGNRGRRGRRRNGGLGDSGRSARPDRRAGRGVHRPDRHGPARDARRNGHRGGRPGRIPGVPANGCRGCCSCIHHGDPAGDRHGPAPGGRLASAAGIFPARILTIIAGVFPASFLAARSLATAGIALPLIATISARPLATAALLAAILAGVLTMAFVFATTVLALVAAVFAAAGARPVVPPPRRRVTARARLGMAATAAIRPRGPGGPLGTLDRGAGLALRAREERPSVAPFARLGGGRTGTRRLGFAHGVFQIRRHRSALVNAIAGLMAG